jgi:hypothetical protein
MLNDLTRDDFPLEFLVKYYLGLESSIELRSVCLWRNRAFRKINPISSPPLVFLKKRDIISLNETRTEEEAT